MILLIVVGVIVIATLIVAAAVIGIRRKRSELQILVLSLCTAPCLCLSVLVSVCPSVQSVPVGHSNILMQLFQVTPTVPVRSRLFTRRLALLLTLPSNLRQIISPEISPDEASPVDRIRPTVKRHQLPMKRHISEYHHHNRRFINVVMFQARNFV